MWGIAATLALSVGVGSQTVDFSQAELFLRFLRAAASGNVAPALIDSVLQHPGTALVIRQQNISRDVTAGQYRAILLHANDSVPPAFALPLSERGQRGVRGLVQDIWPAVHWGVHNVAILEKRLEEFRRVDFEQAARQRAQQYLPEGAHFEVKPFVVMGGRAGGAAFDDGEIYFDLLIESHRATLRNEEFPAAESFTGFFAHEMHHVGLAPVIAGTRARLTLTPEQARAFDFLTFLVTEGSASYLVGPRDLEVMRRSPMFSTYLNKTTELIETVASVIDGVLHAGLSGEALDRAQAPLVGSGWHAAGAHMLAAIDVAGGLAAVMPILSDPRQLFVAYNRARGQPAISERLAEEASKLGEPR